MGDKLLYRVIATLQRLCYITVTSRPMAKTKTVKAKIGMRELKALGPDSELLDTSILGSGRDASPVLQSSLRWSIGVEAMVSSGERRLGVGAR